MKVDAAPAADEPHLFRRAVLIYRTETGQPLGTWALVALLNLLAQIIFRREFHPGEFGTLNSALAAIGLLTIPALAVNQAFRQYLDRPHPADQAPRLESLRSAALLATETFGWVWGAICFALVFTLAPLLALPRSSLQLFLLMNVLIAVGGVISCAVCEQGGRRRLWGWLLVSAALARVVAGAGLAPLEPWAESGLSAFLLAGFITIIPALQAREVNPAARLAASRALWDRDFLVCLGVTASVLLGLFLFANGDRLVAQNCFGVASLRKIPIPNSPDYGFFTTPVDWSAFDAYQNAGLIARSLLWVTQPLLWIIFAERSRLARTTAISLRFYWIYLGVLVLGVILLFLAAHPVSALFADNAVGAHGFTSTADATARFVPSLAATMLPLGLLQGFGVFALASRRHPECFVFGACSIAYTVVLFFFGRQPELMPGYMFGASLVSLMILLFVGVVRWGRKQP